MATTSTGYFQSIINFTKQNYDSASTLVQQNPAAVGGSLVAVSAMGAAAVYHHRRSHNQIAQGDSAVLEAARNLQQAQALVQGSTEHLEGLRAIQANLDRENKATKTRLSQSQAQLTAAQKERKAAEEQLAGTSRHSESMLGKWRREKAEEKRNREIKEAAKKTEELLVKVSSGQKNTAAFVTSSNDRIDQQQAGLFDDPSGFRSHRSSSTHRSTQTISAEQNGSLSAAPASSGWNWSGLN